VRAKDRLACDDRGESMQQLAEESVLRSQRTMLVVVASQASVAELFAQDSVFPDEVGDDQCLLAVEPAGKRDQKQLAREEVRHQV